MNDWVLALYYMTRPRQCSSIPGAPGSNKDIISICISIIIIIIIAV